MDRFVYFVAGAQTVLIALLLYSGLHGVASAQKAEPTERGFVVYKLGESRATDKDAGDVIDKFLNYLNQPDKVVLRREGIRNQPEDAAKLFDAKRPVGAAIVSPGFFFANEKKLKLTVLGEARRGGNDGEQYFVLGTKKPVEEFPWGRVIATNLTADKKWLDNVVLPLKYPSPKGNIEIHWKQYDNLSDAAYAMIDEEKGAPDYVLVDRITLAAFKKDNDLKELVECWKSEMLPQDLFVEVDGGLENSRDTIKKRIAEMNTTDEGKKLGEAMQTTHFPAVDEKRLEAARKKYR